MHSPSGNEVNNYPSEESENFDADTSWELKHYKYLLFLLRGDCYFPRTFQLDDLNKDEEDQNNLLKFAQERNQLHELIKEDDMQEVEKFTKKIKSKYYFNTDNESAAFTAIKFKKFKIYAYLVKAGAGLHQSESFVIDKGLKDLEKEELRGIMLLYFSKSEESHIHFLISKIKIKSQHSFEEFKETLFNYLKNLNRIPEVSIILKVTQYVDHLNVVLDFDSENVKAICPSATNADKGITLHNQNTIYVAAGGKRSENEVLGTLAHELTHMAMELVFRNDCNPYLISDIDGKKEFVKLKAAIEKNVQKVKDTPSETLMGAFQKFYKNTCQDNSELVARIPHVLAQYTNGRKWLEDNAAKLLKFYDDKIVSECKTFMDQNFLLKQKTFNRYMNESEGDILNIKKSVLFFKNIEKVRIFLNGTNEIFLLITKFTRLGVLRVLQGIFGVNYIQSYDNFLVFKLESLMKNIEDVEYLFSLEATEFLIVDCHDKMVNEYKTLKGLEKIIKIAKEKKNKKVIFILRYEENRHFMEMVKKIGSSVALLKETDEHFSVNNFEKNSREKILSKLVLFQEEEIRLSNLLNDDEDLIKCVNAEMVQDLLDNKKIEIGSKPFKMSDLEGAYADVVLEVNLVSFIKEIKFSEDIFLICGMKEADLRNELGEHLSEGFDLRITNNLNNFKHDTSYGKRAFVIDNKITDGDFKKICGHNEKKKIYLIKKEGGQSKYILLKFYNPGFYFKRQLKVYKKIVISKRILEDCNISFLVLIERKPENDEDKVQQNAVSKNIIFLNPEEIENGFRICSQQSVHVLEWTKESKLIWKKSSFSISELLQWIDEDSSKLELLNENKLINKIKSEKVVILADDPGMGKSTTLTKLYDTGNQFNPLIDTHWVMRIHLKDHLQAIQKMKLDLTMLHVTQFLVEVNDRLKTELGEKLLESALYKIKNVYKPLLIAFDGFDELLDEDDRKKILNLFKFLKNNTNCKFWVTTRLHFRKDLEYELSTLAVRFVPVDDTSKRNFLKKYLKHRLKVILNPEIFDQVFQKGKEMEENSLLWKYATGFIKKVKLIFKGNAENFIGTPLQLQLLLEDCVGTFREWIGNPNDDPDFSYLGNNLFDVYKEFFKRKYDIFFRKMNTLPEAVKVLMKDSLESHHEEVAKSLILKEELPRRTIKHKSLLLLLGIIKTEGDHFEFIHFTFREYTFAHFFLKNVLYPRHFTSSKDSKPFQQKVLVEDEYKLVRVFINEHLKIKKANETLKNPEDIRKFNSWSSRGKKSKTCPLCVAIRENHFHILQFLLPIEFTDFDWFELLKHVNICSQNILDLAIKMKNNFTFNRFTETEFTNSCSKNNLDQRYKLSAIDSYSCETVLHLALRKKDESALNEILEIASKLNSIQQSEFFGIGNSYNNKALHLALKEENELALNQILAKLTSKLHPNDLYEFIIIENSDQDAAFHLAIKANDDHILKRILQLVLKLDIKQQYKLLTMANANHETALHLAMKSNSHRISKRVFKIVSKLDLKQQYKLLTMVNAYHETALHLAMKSNSHHISKQVLEIVSKLDLNLQYKLLIMVNGLYNETALHLAIKAYDDRILKEILQTATKFDLNQLYSLSITKNAYNETGLHLVVSANEDSIFKEILEVMPKLDLNQRYQLFIVPNSYNETVLHLAVQATDDRALKQILKAVTNLDLNQQYELLNFANSYNDTVLHAAVKREDDRIFIRTLEFVSTFDLYQQYKFLCTVNQNKETVLHLAVRKRYIFAFKKLLETVSQFTLNELNELLRIENKSTETVFCKATRKNFALHEVNLFIYLLFLHCSTTTDKRNLCTTRTSSSGKIKGLASRHQGNFRRFFQKFIKK